MVITAFAFIASGPQLLRAGSARTPSSGIWFVRSLTFRRLQPTRAVAALGLVAITVPPVEKTYQTGGQLPGSEEPAVLPDVENMSKKELLELTARLRLVKPKRRKGYKQEITEHQRLQLDAELLSRGFDASEKEVDLLAWRQPAIWSHAAPVLPEPAPTGG